MLFPYIKSIIPLYELSDMLLKEHILTSKASTYEFISFITKIPYSDIPFYINKKINITDDILSYITLLKNGYPLAYIVKQRSFFGLDFYVDNRVLIPRIETEILVENVLKYCSKEESIVLDLCTGSSNILSSVLTYKKQSIGIGVDIDKSALKVAKINVEKLFLQNRAHLVCADALLSDYLFKQQFDIITCNPPYIGINDNIDKNILYEPICALYAKDNGFFYYKKLLPKVVKLCKRGGFIFFEINPLLKHRLKDFSQGLGIDIKIINDLDGYPRVLFWKNI